MSHSDPALPYASELTRPRWVSRWAQPQIAVLVVGIAAWAFGLTRLRLPGPGSYGLLADGDVWLIVGLAAPVISLVLELRGERRGWLMAVSLIALIVAVHATVPLLYHVPEYAWVYKHIGIASAFERYGRVTDPSNIYQQWPALFAAVAALASLGHVTIASLALWSPLAFELADALLLFAIFRLLSEDRRVAYLGVALYVGMVAWVGQDYLSPQAFSYLLWLGIAYIVLRWLRPAVIGQTGRLARLRAPLVAGMAPAPEVSPRVRRVMVAVAVLLYFAIVAAHQLTPYIILAGIGALTLLDLVAPRYLVVLMAVVAGAYLAPHYGLIASNFGGLFSGSNPVANASGSAGTHHAGPEAFTALVVRGLAAVMWLASLAVLWRRRRSLGGVLIPAVLAFSPFVVLGAQSYGGEAIYRVYLFSSPWCALLIAGALCERTPRLRWTLAGALSLLALFAGAQGLWGPVSYDAFTSGELTASRWVYDHAPVGSTIVLPDQNFPGLESADYNHYSLQVMPADPELGAAWLNEGDLPQVRRWLAGLGQRSVYVVVSRSMDTSAAYFGAPRGYHKLVASLPGALGGKVVYRNADATVYRVRTA